MITSQIMEEVKKRLIQTYNPIEIYIFGSHARGTADEESDLDLLVVVDECDPKDRFKAMSEGHRALFGLDISKDIIVLSKDEFDIASTNPQRIFYRIKQEGKQIYAREGYYDCRIFIPSLLSLPAYCTTRAHKPMSIKRAASATTPCTEVGFSIDAIIS